MSIASSRDGSRQVIAGLQTRYAEATGIKSLKVRHNNVLGYFVEVTAHQCRRSRQAAACRAVRAPPDARQCHALLHARAWRARSAHHHRRRPRARARARYLRAAHRARARRAGAACRARAPLSPSSIIMPASPSLPSSRTMCGRRSMRAWSSPSSKAATPWSSRLWRAATAPTSSATIAGSAAETKTPARASWW